MRHFHRLILHCLRNVLESLTFQRCSWTLGLNTTDLHSSRVIPFAIPLRMFSYKTLRLLRCRIKIWCHGLWPFCWIMLYFLCVTKDFELGFNERTKKGWIISHPSFGAKLTYKGQTTFNKWNQGSLEKSIRVFPYIQPSTHSVFVAFCETWASFF